MIETIKIISSISSILGASILAYRVTGILKSLSLVAHFHDDSIKKITSFVANPHQNIVIGVNSNQHVARAEKMPLLLIGFGLTILSGVLQLIALFINNGWFNA